MAAEVKPRNNRLLMVLGIIIAVVAFLLVVLLAPGKGGGGGDRNQTVLVTAVDVPAGQQISESLINGNVKFAADQVPAGALTVPKEAVGQYAAVALPKNTVLTSANLVSSVAKLPPAKRPYLDIPPGQVAIAIPAGGELQAVAGYIQQDDRVDILFNPSGTSKNTWKVTYQNLKIARIGPAAAASGSGQAQQSSGTASSMIVYVSLDDAENLAELFSSGNYKLALRSQQDAGKNDVASTAGATSDSLLAKFNVPK